MGNSFNKQEIRIVVRGLDAIGASTNLYKLKLGDVGATVPKELAKILSQTPTQQETPTPGIQIEKVDSLSWDYGGRALFMPLKHHYSSEASALIWIMDATDRAGIGEVGAELRLQLRVQLAHCPVLVLANKLDASNAMDIKEITSRLELPLLTQRCRVGGTSEAELAEGLKWLSSSIFMGLATDYLHLPPVPKLPSLPAPPNPLTFFKSIFDCTKAEANVGLVQNSANTITL